MIKDLTQRKCTKFKLVSTTHVFYSESIDASDMCILYPSSPYKLDGKYRDKIALADDDDWCKANTSCFISGWGSLSVSFYIILQAEPQEPPERE